MISFFKFNDPIRIIGLFLLILLIRLPLIFTGIPLSTPEFSWMLLGEKINEGLLIYRDIDDNAGPFTATFFNWTYYLFGRSQIAFQILSLVLVFVQALYFNIVLNNWNALKENNYIPGMFFVVVGSFSFEFYTLSPTMLSVTFLLIAFKHFIAIIKSGSKDDRIFLIGFHTSIAALFYMPSIIFAFWVLFAFILFTNVSFRRYGVFLFGLLFPIGMFSLYFYWQESLTKFVSDILYYSFIVKSLRYVTYTQIGIFSAPLMVLLAISIVKSNTARGFINYQRLIQLYLVGFTLLSIATLFLAFRISFANLYVFVPAMAYFFTIYFTEFSRKWLRKIVATLFISGTILMGYSASFDIPYLNQFHREPLTVKTEKSVNYGRVLVLDNDLTLLNNNKQATRFVNWELSKRYFQNPNQFEQITTVYNSLNEDLPDAIFDPNNLMLMVFDRMPSIATKYKKEESGVYVKIAN